MPLPNWAGGIAGWAKEHKGPAAGIGALFLLLVMVLFMSGGGEQADQQASVEEDMFGAGALPDDATTSSALAQMERIMESLRIELRQQQERDDKLAQAIDQQNHAFETRLGDQERAYTDQLEAALKQAIELARQTGEQSDTAALGSQPPLVPTLRILRPAAPPGVPGSPGLEQGQQAAQQQTGRPGGPWVRLPLGSTVTGELMTGAFATKVRGDALPVLVQLRSAYTGPNDTEIPLEDCLLIGKATADISSVRARVEAVSLSCVLPDGTAFERQVKGYFTGEDGTLGVPGKWEFRSGRWLANLLSAMGTVAGGVYADLKIAEALANLTVNTQGQGGGITVGGITTSGVTARIQDFFIERAEEILPVVWVESGTPVYVVMLEGLTIEGLPAEEYDPVALSVWD